jgi:hypothetical protein
MNSLELFDNQEEAAKASGSGGSGFAAIRPLTEVVHNDVALPAKKRKEDYPDGIDVTWFNAPLVNPDRTGENTKAFLPNYVPYLQGSFISAPPTGMNAPFQVTVYAPTPAMGRKTTQGLVKPEDTYGGAQAIGYTIVPAGTQLEKVEINKVNYLVLPNGFLGRRQHRMLFMDTQGVVRTLILKGFAYGTYKENILEPSTPSDGGKRRHVMGKLELSQEGKVTSFAFTKTKELTGKEAESFDSQLAAMSIDPTKAYYEPYVAFDQLEAFDKKLTSASAATEEAQTNNEFGQSDIFNLGE